MELLEILNSQIVCLFRVRSERGGPFLPDFVARVSERYEFANVPTIPDALSKDHIEFEHGVFDDKVVEKLRIYNDGIIVDTRTRTTHADAVIDDLLAWTMDAFAVEYKRGAVPVRYYSSHLEVLADFDLGGWLEDLAKIAELVGGELRNSSGVEKEYDVFGFSLHFDPTRSKGSQGQLPGRFNIERRLGHPYRDGIYSTVAPLKTDNHLRALKAIEDLAKRG